MKLSYVELLFTDGFGAHIRGDHVGDTYIYDIAPGFFGAAGELEPVNYAGSVAIEIHKNANNERDDDELDLFSRICAYNDITDIRFQFENDRTIHSFKVDTHFQKTYISSLGHLYIVISPRGLSNFFDVDSLEDKNTVSAHFRPLKKKGQNNEQ